MSDGSEDDEKQFQPTQKKLDDARKKGDIPRSTDLNTAASYGGILLVAVTLGADTILDFGQILSELVGNADRISKVFVDDSTLRLSNWIFYSLLISVGSWFLIPGLVVLLAIFSQRSFVVAPEKLMPKLSRISPLSNAKNKFGRNGIFEFLKSFFKLLIYSIILTVFLKNRLPEILGTVLLSPAMATNTLLRLVVEFLSIVLITAFAVGAVDFIWQKTEHTRRNMMSRKEMTDETKQSEGDPHVKHQRRQKGYEIAMNQMLADVPKADVIIVNPTHYAVALKWNRSKAAAPVCVAKGVDEIAARIRELAIEAAVPIHQDPASARLLFATVEIGQEIRPDHYQAVAASIRFAEQMRKRAKHNVASR